MVVGVLTTNTANITSNGAGNVTYFHADHLGSVVAMSVAGGVLESERRSYDPWGRPRKVDGSINNGELPNGVNAATDRGFTLHEHLENLSLVNMNGRVYDFVTGRFVSPDPVVQDPNDSQSYNRYAYVMNRPLNSTDPTGYEGEWVGGCTVCFGSGSLGSGWPITMASVTSQFSLGGSAPPMIGNGVTLNSSQRINITQSYNNFIELQSFMQLTESSRLGGGGFAAKGVTASDVASSLWNSSDNWIGLSRNVATAVGTTALNLVNFLGAGVAGDSQWAADSADALLNKGAGATVATAMLVAGRLAAPRVTAEFGIAYNGVTGPGPLGAKVAGTFRSGTYTELTTSEATTLYRVWGGKAGELGPYWTRTAPSGPVQSAVDSALNPAWGNTATNVTRIQVPAGVKIYEGIAARQGGLVGGGSQVFVPKVDPAWIVR